MDKIKVLVIASLICWKTSCAAAANLFLCRSGMPTSEKASSPPPSPDVHLQLSFLPVKVFLCKHFPQKQYLPLDFSVFTAHEQAELEFSAEEARCLATGMSGVS